MMAIMRLKIFSTRRTFQTGATLNRAKALRDALWWLTETHLKLFLCHISVPSKKNRISRRSSIILFWLQGANVNHHIEEIWFGIYNSESGCWIYRVMVNLEAATPHSVWRISVVISYPLEAPSCFWEKVETNGNFQRCMVPEKRCLDPTA